MKPEKIIKEVFSRTGWEKVSVIRYEDGFLVQVHDPIATRLIDGREKSPGVLVSVSNNEATIIPLFDVADIWLAKAVNAALTIGFLIRQDDKAVAA